MSKELVIGMKLWLVLVIAFIAHMCVGKAHSQQVSIISAPLGGYGGITTCDQYNNIVVVINHVGKENYDYILRHEMVHVADMKAYKGGCIAMMTRFRAEESFRQTVEFHAYCSDYEYSVREGIPKESINNLASYLQRLYAQDKTVEQVRAMLPCGKDVIIPRDSVSVAPT